MRWPNSFRNRLKRAWCVLTGGHIWFYPPRCTDKSCRACGYYIIGGRK